MATTAHGVHGVGTIPVSAGGSGVVAGQVHVALAGGRRRRISPEAGRAIEMLGHAIEYLADEFSLECMEAKQAGRAMEGRRHPRIEAIQMLMERNREVYFSCPVVPTLKERMQGWMRR